MNKCGICGKESNDLVQNSLDFVPKCRDCMDPLLVVLLDYMRSCAKNNEANKSSDCNNCGNADIMCSESMSTKAAEE